MILSSRATCNSSFHTEYVHGSEFSDQKKHFRTLVPAIKCIVLISSIILRNLSVELHCTLDVYCTVFINMNGYCVLSTYCTYVFRKVLTLKNYSIP